MSLLLAAAAAPVAQGAGLSPSQILYTSDWTGPFKALALDPLGVRQPADASGLHATCRDPERTCGFVHVTASPDGRHVAFASEDYEQAWIRTVNGILLPLAHVRSLPTWSPDSRSLAYVASDGLHVANADGRSDYLVDGNTDDASPSWGPPGRGLVFLRGAIGTSTQELVRLRNGRAGTIGSAGCKTLSWSADGRFFACAWENVFDFSVYVLDAKGHSIRTRLVSDAVPQWSPKGSRLALGSVPGKTGVRILDPRTRRTRTLPSPDDAIAVAWAPNGRSIAYLSRGGRSRLRRTGDLREVTLSGKLRTLVSADGVPGGTMTEIAWTRSPGATAWPALPPQDGILADAGVSALAAAGERAAYVACGLPFVWMPPNAPPTLLPGPTTEPANEFARGCRRREDRQRAEGIALGSRAALYDWCNCPTGYSSVQAVDLSSSTAQEVGRGSGTPGPSNGYGTVLGDDSLLLFSGWESQGVIRQTRTVTRARIYRLGGGSCPCPAIAEGTGRLEPLDVDMGRIAARRGDGTVVLDANGNELLTLAVTPLAAQLTGNHLLVVVPREVRDYDLRSAELLHSWSFGQVSLGRECQGWFDPGCFVGMPSGEACDITGFFTMGCGLPDLRVEDAARGLLSYVMDDEIHLRRLSDGADAIVGPGLLSRFTSSGLVYADGARLHLVTFAALPLR